MQRRQLCKALVAMGMFVAGAPDPAGAQGLAQSILVASGFTQPI